jgi:hypothetical protein
MVIIEINRNYPGVQYLLGAHKWSDFLINPSQEEKSRESRIYWCTYKSGRETEKHGKYPYPSCISRLERFAGYKRVMIEDTWFKRKGPYAKHYHEFDA